MCHADLYARPEVFPSARSQPGVRGDLSPSAARGRGQGGGAGARGPQGVLPAASPCQRAMEKTPAAEPQCFCAFAISTSALASFLSPLTPQIKG